MKKPKDISKNNLTGEHPFGDRGQIILFILFMVIWILDSFVFRFSTILSVYLPVYIRLPIAIITIVFAGYFIKVGHTVIEEKQDTPNVIKTKVFLFVRHPIYFGTLLFYKGLVISTLSLISFALLCIIFLFYNHIAEYEEKLLENRFDKEYLEYKKMVSRWLPVKFIGRNLFWFMG